MTKLAYLVAVLPLQPGVSAQQQFDAVSIKQNTSGARERSFRANPGQIVAVNVPVRLIIQNAFNMSDFEISGGPEWIASERYDLTARSSKNPIAPDDLREMLRATLADRFKLRARVVVQEQPIYALILARPGTLGERLRRVTGPCDPAQPQRVCGFNFNGSRLASNAVSIPRLAQELRGIVERHVEDRTGLHGLYEVLVEWSPDQQNDGPSLFTALQEQLGLRLEPQRGPVEVLQIDSIERPAEN
jgi:uncharacterized protein (TIGR03435 family)